MAALDNGIAVKIIIAPDSFKESLSATEAAQAIATGIAHVMPHAECFCLPMADGGEGTAETIRALCGGRWRTIRAQNPLGRPIRVRYALLADNRAAIDMASACGLTLLDQSQRNPLHTHTFGVGQMILDALEQGVEHIIIGIGGSATNDGGCGMLHALGVRFYDGNGQSLPPTPSAMANLAEVDLSKLDSRLDHTTITIACDVNNPLLGDQGASAVFGPQKGADAQIVKRLDAILTSYAEKLIAAGFADHRQTQGSGAAGGLGFALLGLPQSHLTPGIDLIMELAKLDDIAQDADLIITGEGRMDGQTLSGKVPMGVLRLAQRRRIPTIALCGCLGRDSERLNDIGFTAIFPIIAQPDNLDNTLKDGAKNLTRTTIQVMHLIKRFSSIHRLK